MRRFHTTPAGAPAVALSLALAGCGGGSGGGAEQVVDFSNPGVAGPQGAPAPAPAPAAPVQGAPTGFAGQGDAGGGAVASRGPAADGGGLGLNEMLAAAKAANDPEAPRGLSAPGGGAAPGAADNQAYMMGMMGDPGMEGMPGDSPYDQGYGGPGMADAGGFGEYGPGGFGEMPGDLGGPGDAGGPDDFESPQGAVKAFLAAAEAKDVRRLSDATALRAPREAESAARRRTFQAIREESLSDSELTTIADDLEGFQISQAPRPIAGGIFRFVLSKQGEYGSTLRRTIDVRKERAGWKVADISGVAEIKQMGGRAMEQRFNRNRNNQDGAGGGYDGGP